MDVDLRLLLKNATGSNKPQQRDASPGSDATAGEGSAGTAASPEAAVGPAAGVGGTEAALRAVTEQQAAAEVEAKAAAAAAAAAASYNWQKRADAFHTRALLVSWTVATLWLLCVCAVCLAA